MEEKQELKVRHKIYTFTIEAVDNIPELIVNALVLVGGYEVDDEYIPLQQNCNNEFIPSIQYNSRGKVKITVYRIEKKIR